MKPRLPWVLPPLLGRGLTLLCLAATLTGLHSGCSSTTEATPNPAPSAADKVTVDAAATPVQPRDASAAQTTPRRMAAPSPAASQDQTPAEQRRRFLINENLKKARRAMELKLWDDARQAAARVLELDGTNEEARGILQQAGAILGDRAPTVQDRVRRAQLQAEIEKQRDLFRAREFEREADLQSQQGEFQKAQELLERARLTLRYSPWFTPGGEDQKRIEAKIKRAHEDQAAQRERRAEEIERRSRQELLEEEREARHRLERQVSELFLQANVNFQHQQYGRSVKFLDEALKLDPLREDAKRLRELAMRARHDQSLAQLEREWAKQWANTFQDLDFSNLPQTEAIKHDVEYWRNVALKRGPLEFSDWDVTEDPDTAAIIRTLEETVIEHNFPETPLADWVDFYRRATGLTFAISPKVTELDESETTLERFSVGKRSVRSALDLITRLKPIRWKVQDGVVQLLTAEEGRGQTVTRMYDVREITNPLAQHPGRDILLRTGEEEDLGAEEEEPLPVVVDIDKLQELLRANVEPLSWEGEGVTINPQGSTLVIAQTPEVHRKIQQLLKDLRGTSGIQVDIESRFLRVEDNFLEEIGVDFRGLGNQAAEGIPGRGLEKQGDRTGFQFDDFGLNTSPQEPQDIGSGFEPGFFFDDGGDGDIFGRSENLFDRVLGGGEEGLSNAGGLSFQWAYLDDSEFQLILRAVEKKERVEQLSAPRLLVHNTARANLAVNRQFSYIRDFNVEIAQAAAVADPVVDVIRDGVVLDVRPVVAADRKYILMELRPTVATLALPIPTFTTSLGVGQPVSIQVPRLTLQKVRTTVVMPDGGVLLLGGMKTAQKQQFDTGIPVLKDLPGLSFFFSRKGTYRANKKILILLRASVIVPTEFEPAVDVR